MEKFLVGGAVRDIVKFMIDNNMPFHTLKENFELIVKKAKINDMDFVVVGETPETMKKKGFIPVGKSFPVFLHPKTKDEYALARLEIKTGDKHTDFSCEFENVSLEEDLTLRRDLTINSMAIDSDFNIIDPANGISDLKKKILRHTSDKFSEDVLRVLRIARFNSRFSDFTIAEETVKLCKSIKDDLVHISKERIFMELKKVLGENKPSIFFRILKDFEALEITFPHIHSMIGIPQRADFHSEGDVFEHTMMVLDSICTITKEKEARFAALFHDIGKPITFKNTGKLHGHDKEEIINELFEDLKSNHRVPKSFIKAGKQAAMFHHFIHDFDKRTIKSIRKKFDDKQFPKSFKDLDRLIKVANADQVGRIISKKCVNISHEDKTKLLNGEEVKGFFIPEMENHSNILKAFVSFQERTIIPDEIKGNVEQIKQYLIKDKIKKIKEGLCA